MKRFYLIVLSLLILLFFGEAHAKANHAFVNCFTENNSLSHEEVRCVLQDSRGYLWIGTTMGLNRFDGTRVKQYYHDILPAEYIFCLCEDKKGNIWVGTSAGVCYYSYDTDSFTTVSSESKPISGPVSSIACSPSGEIWFDMGTRVLFSYNDGLIQEHEMNIPDCKKIVSFDSNGRVFISCSYCGIYIYDGHKFSELSSEIAPYFTHDECTNLLVSKKSNSVFYVASKSNGLCEVDLRKDKITVLYKWRVNQKPVSLIYDNGTAIMALTSDGIVRYDVEMARIATINHHSDDPFSIPESYVTSAVVDKNGGLWVGTYSSGLAYSDRGKNGFDNICMASDGTPLKGTGIRDFAEGTDGRVYVATERLGLLRFDPKTHKLDRVYKDILPSFLTAVCFDGVNLWVGTQKGIEKINIKSSDIRHYLKDNATGDGNRVNCFYRSTSGVLYAGTVEGLMRYDESADGFYLYPNLKHKSVFGVAEDKNGALWLSTYFKGVIKFNPESENPEEIKEYGGKGEIMTSDIFIDNKGSIWTVGVGSYFSMYSQTKDKFIPYGDCQYSIMPKSVFQSVQQDDEGSLWFSTTSGIFRFSSTGSRLYSVTEGVLNNNFNGNASLKTASGQIMFGSKDGIIIFSPDKLLPGKNRGKLHITSMSVNGVEVKPSESGILGCNVNYADLICLSHDQNNLAFEFATPGYGNVGYLKCQLVGHENTEHEISEDGIIEYNDLAPGSYLLRLADRAPLKIIVKPPFWQTPVFACLIVCAILLLSVSLMFLTRYLDKRKHLRQLERHRKAEAEAQVRDKMEFLANVLHEINNPLTMMKSPLNSLLCQSLSDDIAKPLRTISKSVRQLDSLSKELLSYLKSEKTVPELHISAIDVTSEINMMLSNYAEMARSRNMVFKTINLESPHYVDVDKKSLNRILSNLITNALKYAESYLEIEVVIKDETTLILFRNDGSIIPENSREKIFKPFVRLVASEQLQQSGFGIGLAYARNLAQLLGGSLTLSPSLKTEFILELKKSLQEPVIMDQDYLLENFGHSKFNILIIEDNTDLREFLKTSLEDTYNVYEAITAEEGMSIVFKNPIDLIISDLMMPGIGGVELCERLSVSFETSHIPIIIISAVTDELARIKCIKNGAVFFIEKPFSVEYLLACIAVVTKKLATIRQNVMESSVDMSVFNIKDRDADFLQSLAAIVDAHINDSTFTARQLEQELGISHTSMNRKLNGLIKMTPIDYIRNRRLAMAAKILLENKVNVAEVCYMVGFNTPAYFIKCFRKVYGMTPSEFVKEKKS